MKGVIERRTWRQLEGIDAVHRLAEFVHDGGLVVFPTESSYALGADPRNERAVSAVYRLKDRARSKPFPVVVGSTAILGVLGVREGGCEDCSALKRAWPGPLSIVLPLAGPLPAASGRSDVAVRIPGHRRLRETLAAGAFALTATSANLAGEAPLLDPDQFEDLVADEDVLLIDEGRLPGGPPSTLVRCDAGRVTVLRAGALAVEELRAFAPSVEFVSGFSASSVEIPVEDAS